ncbi:MAG: ArsR/SmtB family transcription factor [Chitinispirillaceae bacterium]
MEDPDLTILKALAAEPRARIVSLLCCRCLCAGALARMLDITPGAVSQHLGVLKKCGLIIGERRGYFMHYRIARDARDRAKMAIDALFDGESGLPNKSGQCVKKCSCSKHGENGDRRSTSP